MLNVGRYMRRLKGELKRNNARIVTNEDSHMNDGTIKNEETPELDPMPLQEEDGEDEEDAPTPVYLYHYGSGSRTNRATIHQHLKNIFDEVLLKHDHSMTCGARQPDAQQDLFKNKRSQVPGRLPNGEVNNYPHMPRGEDGLSWAVDVWPYIDNRALIVQDYSVIRQSIFQGAENKYLVKVLGQYCQFAFFAGLVTEIASDYFDKIGNPFRLIWGGNWNEDATILVDQGFDDFPHWELVENTP